MNLEIRTKFEGGEAEYNRIPAYEGAESIHGLMRSLTLVTHYAVTGKIRRRYPYTPAARLFLAPPRAGSWEAVVEILTSPGVILIGSAVGAITVNLTSSILYDLIKTVFSRTIGEEKEPNTSAVKQVDSKRSGDLDALSDAIEPGLRLGHTVINYGVQNINIISPSGEKINLNAKTKDYISDEIINDNEESQDASVGSYNVNGKNGRIFFHDLKKTVPFKISGDAHPRTQSVLSYSLDRYANKTPSDVTISFRRITSSDGRTKRILIHDARKTPKEP